MQPVILCDAVHDQQAAGLQLYRDRLARLSVPKRKFPFGAKAQGGNGAILFKGLLIVAVPGHAFFAGMIEVQQTGIECFAGERSTLGF
jgi:hypothetical protein